MTGAGVAKGWSRIRFEDVLRKMWSWFGIHPFLPDPLSSVLRRSLDKPGAPNGATSASIDIQSAWGERRIFSRRPGHLVVLRGEHHSMSSDGAFLTLRRRSTHVGCGGMSTVVIKCRMFQL